MRRDGQGFLVDAADVAFAGRQMRSAGDVQRFGIGADGVGDKAHAEGLKAHLAGHEPAGFARCVFGADPEDFAAVVQNPRGGIAIHGHRKWSRDAPIPGVARWARQVANELDFVLAAARRAHRHALGKAAAEAARDTRIYAGFLSGLFEGKVRRQLYTRASLPPRSEAASEFLDRLRQLLVEKVDPERIDREGLIGEDVFVALREIGAFGIKIPGGYGGLGFTQSEYHEAATLLGSHDAATTVLLSAHNSIGVAEPVKLVGNQEQQQRLLPRLARGEVSGFALTEKGAGCDIWDLKTYAIPVHEDGVLVGYRLTGDKLYTTNAPREPHAFLASWLVVIAQIVDSPDDIHRPKEARRFGAFVVDTHTRGCSCTRLSFMGVRGIYNGQVHLREVWVPVADRLGAEGEGLRRALESLTVGRLTLPAACLGNLKQCLYLARLRAQQRRQYDRPIGEHTDIGGKIVLMASRVLALEAIVKITGIWADTKQDVRLESAAAKSWRRNGSWNRCSIYSASMAAVRLRRRTPCVSTAICRHRLNE